MIKACVFDLDGTLSYTLDSMAYVANEVLSSLELKTLPVENFKYYCGEGASVLVQRCLKDAGDPQLQRFEECERLYREKFNEDPLYKVVPYEGVAEVIRELKKEGVKISVCSNKPHEATRKVIEKLFGGEFDMVLGQKPEIRRKPAPDGPLYIAGEFGVKPQECMYIGDTGTDMNTGKAAGMFTVGVLWGYRDRKELEENGADILAEKPEDLLEIYRNENKKQK